jgi:CubicO group peptidase (beta-lactamase class C family)
LTAICRNLNATKKPAVILTISAILFLGVFAGCNNNSKAVGPENVGLSTERLARFDQAMQVEIDQKHKAGIVVLVARHGSIAYQKAFGMADIESGKKMQTDYLFRLFSMTKPITSVALLTLYEEGKFQLNDPLEKYIPGFKDVKVFVKLDEKGEMVLEAPKRKISMQDVFRHTAGFGYGGDDSTPVGKAYKQAGFGKLESLKDLVDKLTKVPLLYQPGERWVYSYSHDVQARLVEILSGMSFDKYVQAKILQPLGMKDTVFGVPKSFVPRYTTCYGPAKEGGLQATDKPEGGDYAGYTERPFGGHSLSSTAFDYYLFSQMLLNKGTLNGTRILGRKTVELMTSNNLPLQLPSLGAMGPGTGYGLGVSVLLDSAQEGNLGSKGQFGWGGAATTWVIIDPKEDMISLFFTQYMPMDKNIVDRFQTLVYQAIVD